SQENMFTARIPLACSEEFREFVRRRVASLSQVDELVVLRQLWATDSSPVAQLASALQRGTDIAGRILKTMEAKQMIEQVDNTQYRLSSAIRQDIRAIFSAD